MWKYVRRNSPSVMPVRPASSWKRTMSRIARVLDGAQLGRADLVLFPALARLEQRLRSQEAADVVGAERRSGASGHRDLRKMARGRKGDSARVAAGRAGRPRRHDKQNRAAWEAEGMPRGALERIMAAGCAVAPARRRMRVAHTLRKPRRIDMQRIVQVGRRGLLHVIAALALLLGVPFAPPAVAGDRRRCLQDRADPAADRAFRLDRPADRGGVPPVHRAATATPSRAARSSSSSRTTPASRRRRPSASRRTSSCRTRCRCSPASA